jgi:aryl-alcohol dehydrogenase-like predicted oxidoreductase
LQRCGLKSYEQNKELSMKYRKLGNSGASVSNLILGTMGFGTETPEKEAFAILDAYLET